MIAAALAIGARRLDAGRGLAILGGTEAAAARALVAGGAAIEPLDDPRPRGWRQIEPSWIEHALAGEDDRVRAIVASDRVDPLACWLARWFLAELVAMPAPGPASAAGELARLAPRALARTLDALGRRQLAHAIAGAPPAQQASFGARVPWAAALAAELAAVRALGTAAAEAALGRRTAALGRTADLAWDQPTAAAIAGARAIAGVLDGDCARQIAQRLPRAIGLTLLPALRGDGGGGDPVSAAEVVRAIAAAG